MALEAYFALATRPQTVAVLPIKCIASAAEMFEASARILDGTPNTATATISARTWMGVLELFFHRERVGFRSYIKCLGSQDSTTVGKRRLVQNRISSCDSRHDKSTDPPAPT